MDGSEIAACRRSWSDILSGPPAQTANQDVRPAFLGQEGGGRTRNERRMQDRDPLAYSRSKTVQTMGGSSVNDRQGIIKLVSDIQKGARRMNLYVLTHIVMYIKDVE